MTDYENEQEMEISALEAILMDDFKEVCFNESGLNSSNRFFQIVISMLGDDEYDSTNAPVQLALIFAHTAKYPDESPHLYLKCIRGMQPGDLKLLKEKLEHEALENLGMSMIYTLVTSAKEWLHERYNQDAHDGNIEEKEDKDDDIVVPHGETVTVETFLAWRERFEAELALQKAKLIPESALAAQKEKKLTGRQWFESGRVKGAVAVEEAAEEEEDFGDIDFSDDEEDMLEHYLSERSDAPLYSSSSSSSKRPS